MAENKKNQKNFDFNEYLENAIVNDRKRFDQKLNKDLKQLFNEKIPEKEIIKNDK